MLAGAEQGARPIGRAGRTWATRLATGFLTDPLGPYRDWRTAPLDRRPYPGNKWQIVDPTGGDPASKQRFLASGPPDGQGNSVSVMLSPVFEMPESLSFTLLGRKNPPGEEQQPTPPENRVELILQITGEVLESVEVTQPETKERIAWQGGAHTGQKVRLQLVDGSAAWGEFVAAGAFEPQVVRLPPVSPEQTVERQLFAARMAADFRIRELTPALRQLAETPAVDVQVRNEAVKALLTLDDPEVIRIAEKLLEEEGISLKLKELCLVTLSDAKLKKARSLILPYLQEIPYESQKQVILNLAGTPEGIDYLLGAGEEALVLPRLLLEPQVIERLQARMSGDQQNRYGLLVKNVALPPENIDALIDKRLRGYSPAAFSPDKGNTAFSVYCGVCHKTGGQGGDIGPQLDGVGNWGARALAEKILDPNRNISRAFTVYTVKLKDGTVKSGLLRREEGQTVVFADVQGREFSLDKGLIEERKPSSYTLMPDHFRQTIPEPEFKDLLAYLLSLKAEMK